MIPKTIHYVFGVDKKLSDEKPFKFFHYLNILSAHKTNPGYKINLYYCNEFTCPWIDELKKMCSFVKLYKIPKIPFFYSEHIGDYIRLEILKNSGGIYLDIDTICLKKFDDLLDNECVMGLEYGRHEFESQKQLIGMCNAVVLSKPDGKFINEWKDTYHSDYNQNWNYNSVRIPFKLSQSYPSYIKILDQNCFFKFSWDSDGRRDMFELNSDVGDCYVIHEWESKNYDILSRLNEEEILNTNNTICNLYKKYI